MTLLEKDAILVESVLEMSPGKILWRRRLMLFSAAGFGFLAIVSVWDSIESGELDLRGLGLFGAMTAFMVLQAQHLRIVRALAEHYAATRPADAGGDS